MPLKRDKVSLARALSKLGYTSRAKAGSYIRSGKVTVNGKTVTDPATLVDIGKDSIEVNEKILARPNTIVVMLHKPRGYVTTSSDELSRKTVYELVPNDLHLFAVGRLDMDTSGLLLFTNDGNLQNKITSPEKNVSKTYLATVTGKVSAYKLDKFHRGIDIGTGTIVKADECRIVSTEPSSTNVELKIHEGKNRQVRKMFEAIGKKVARLHRSAIGKLELDVPEGSWRTLSENEIETIFR